MSHQDRREPLPKGYQYGDAGGGARTILLEADEFIIGELPKGTTVHQKRWRPLHENAAAQLARLTVQEDEEARDLMEANGILREGQH